MKKILIVDDSREIRDLVSVTLRRGGREVLEADTGEKAIEIAREHQPDLVMMDIMMPGKIDGFEAVRILKSDERTAHAKVIFLTAKGQRSDMEKGLEVGADDYFVKPFSPLDLMRKVDSIIGD